MRFAVGYQLPNDDGSFVDIVRDFRETIAEVYFPWMNFATGRASISEQHGRVDWRAQRDVEADLLALKALGVTLDLLINGNCLGHQARSVYLENQVRSTLDYLQETVGAIAIVTTASPAVAHILKKHFPAIEVRASVNMRIGTVKGMQYLEPLFDAFHVQRECNRDLARIRELKAWADAHGKRLILLANSGCMNHCSGQTFHDNCVAHEVAMDETANMRDFRMHACWNYLAAAEAHRVSVLQNSWIRPEDLHHYEPFFDVVKLATRMHQHPRLVVQAYADRRYHGNLLDLCEPGFASAFAPYIIDNDRFPADWFAHTSGCDQACHRCAYCEQTLASVLVKMDEASA